MNTLRILNLRVIAALLLTLAAPLVLYAQQPAAPDPTEAYAGRVPGVVYVQFRAGYLPPDVPSNGAGVVAGNEDPVQKIFREIGVDSIKQFDAVAYKDSISHRLGIDRIYDVYYSSNAQPLGVVVRLLQTGLVETSSPRYIFKPQWVPNDPSLGTGQQYYILNIQAESAWDITRGDSNVIIADVDEGVNINHEDLKANIKHTPGNDASDGYPNDSVGWNTALNNDVVTPPPCGSDCEGDHGTMTTGCFGSVANNGIGLAGVAPNCKILVVRISDNNGQLTGAYEGIHYASTYCAKYARRAVINNSWGGRTDAEALPFGAIFPQEITARGQVCVASAGNYALDNDITPFYPACVPGVLSVGATDENDKPTSFTHYGHSVLVYAPGIDIYTTTIQSPELNKGYTEPTVAGTSFSGPIVAGEVALIMSNDSSLKPEAVKKLVIETCDPIPNKDPYLYHGRVNAGRALSLPPAPSLAIQDYSVGSTFLGTIGPVGNPSNLNVSFINLGRGQASSNLSATILPGAGYTWPNYSPFQSSWPTVSLGAMNEKDTQSGTFQILRTGEYSEGSILINFLVNDATPPDTLSVRVPLVSQPGMTHRLLVQHATGVRQVDAINGWAGFGYYLDYLDPETGNQSTILVSQYSVRGDTGWSVPIDIPGGAPIYSMDAIDKDHAWFASTTDIYATTDGSAPNDISSPGGPIRSIHFSDANNGVLIGDASGSKWNIQTTTDGGNNWTASAAAPLVGQATQSFYNSACWVGKYAWFGTDYGIFRSTNGGSQWINTQITGATKKQKDVMAITFSSDLKYGFAAIHGFTDDTDSAGLFYSLNSQGVDWIHYTLAPTGFIPYAIAFIPGTDTAIITSNVGIFKLGNPANALTYIPAPTSFDARSSQVSVGGTSGALTISAVSLASGIADYTVGSPSSVHGTPQPNGFSLQSWPNPFSTSTTLSFTLPREEHVRILLTDVLGRSITQVFDGSLSQGPHALPVEAGALVNGTYYCTLEMENGERAETSIVIAR